MSLHKKNSEIVAEELHRLIRSGVLKAGEKLDTIETLAKQYHVSRSTIREALSQLKALGLVESVQGGGTYVKMSPLQMPETLTQLQNSSAELMQILQVRKILEVGCIELAAQYRTDSNIEELEKIINQMRDAVGNEEISQVYDANFHLAIAKCTQNPLLQTLMETLSPAMMRTIRDSRKLWLYSEKESAARLFEEHKQMLEAIKAKDSKTAVKVMTKHLFTVESVLAL